MDIPEITRGSFSLYFRPMPLSCASGFGQNIQGSMQFFSPLNPRSLGHDGGLGRDIDRADTMIPGFYWNTSLFFRALRSG